LPLAPQNCALVVGVMHVPLQTICPVPQEDLQMPPVQLGVAPEHVAPAEPEPAPQPAVAPQCWSLVVGSTHTPPQRTCPWLQIVVHTLLLQVVGLWHTVPAEPPASPPHPPAAPQYWLLLVGSTQLPLQSTRPGVQVTAQTPTLHTCPAVHLVPQAPQFVLSVFVSTHVPVPPVGVHSVRPFWQVSEHLPPPHTVPAAQSVPQAPQFALSELVFTHDWPQSVEPGPHAVVHWPPLHTCVEVHAVPQAPQLFESLWRL
jgi:hypothetical protein